MAASARSVASSPMAASVAVCQIALMGVGGHLFQSVREVRMLDGDARAPAQLLRVRLQRLSWRATLPLRTRL